MAVSNVKINACKNATKSSIRFINKAKPETTGAIKKLLKMNIKPNNYIEYIVYDYYK